MNRKICFITGTRAEYFLLSGIMREVQADPDLELQLIATCMHLSPEFGLTVKDIEQDGFTVDKKVEMLLSSDTSTGVIKSMGLALISFAETLEELSPDLVVLLGDRFELLAAASSALIFGIPIAHIHGGEVTEGAFDDAIRHSITKMSNIHFTSTEQYRKRVIQLGEDPEKVFNFGALGAESIRKLEPLSQKELEKKLDFQLGTHCILVTYHPVTLEPNTAQRSFTSLLEAIDEIPGLRIIFTKANADTEGRLINEMIDSYVSRNKEKAIAFTSLGQFLYLSTMKHVGAVVGNSSSGIIETPSFKKPTVNIGDRQKGRVRASNIIDVPPHRKSISSALIQALSPEFMQQISNMACPYSKENTACEIKEIIKKYNLKNCSKKSFYNL